MKKTILLSLVTLSLNAFSGEYENAFPEYYEYCTATQVKYQPEYFEGGTGGAGGHAFIYVHGLCKDYTKDYPQVVPCEEVNEELRTQYPHDGVGISLDSDYKNIMWVAVPGKDLIFNGNLNSKEPMLEKDIEALKDQAFALKVFENVELKTTTDAPLNSKKHSDFATLWSAGTDIAISWGRELRCVKTPINKKSVKQISLYLNAQNNSIYKTEKDYDWSFLYNNCTHLSLNTANAFGLTKEIKVDQSFVKQLGNIAVPANGFMLLADDLVLKKFNKNYLKKNENQMKENQLMGLQVGSLFEYHPAFPNNLIFQTEDIKGVSLPRKRVLKAFKTLKHYDKYFSMNKYTILNENLKMWKEIYETMESSDLHNHYRDSQLNKINHLLNSGY